MYIHMYVCTYIHINCISSFCFSRFSRLSLTHLSLSLSVSFSLPLTLYLFLSLSSSITLSLSPSVSLSLAHAVSLSLFSTLTHFPSLSLSFTPSYLLSLPLFLSLTLAFSLVSVRMYTHQTWKICSHPHLSGFSFVQPFTRFLRCLIPDAATTVNLPSFQTVCLKHTARHRYPHPVAVKVALASVVTSHACHC